MHFSKFVTQIISNLPPELGLEKAKEIGRTPFICIRCIEQFFCQNVFMEWNKAVTRDRSDKPHHVQAQLSFKKTCVKCHIFMSVSLKIEELNTTLCIVLQFAWEGSE